MHDHRPRGSGAEAHDGETIREAQWIAFRHELEAVNVWRWRASYPSPGVMDGTQWSLDLAFPDRVLKAEGRDNYPGAAGAPNGKAEPTVEFHRFLEAVRTLTGGQGFQ